MAEETLVCAGRPVMSARNQIRRYCGLPWPGGEPESWAYEYYDSIPTGPGDQITPADLLPSAALHPGFGGDEMIFFNSGGAEACEEWLSGLPLNVDLADADEPTLERLSELPGSLRGSAYPSCRRSPTVSGHCSFRCSTGPSWTGTGW